MPELAQIIEDIRGEFTAKNQVRDATLNRSRELIRYCALSIRAVHRHEWPEAEQMLATARQAAAVMTADLTSYADLYDAGYTQDALKELVEAHTLFAFVRGGDLPGPAELGVPSAAYLNGLAEAANELRRFTLDLIRLGRSSEGEPYLGDDGRRVQPPGHHGLPGRADRRTAPHYRRPARRAGTHPRRPDRGGAAGRVGNGAAGIRAPERA